MTVEYTEIYKEYKKIYRDYLIIFSYILLTKGTIKVIIDVNLHI